MVEDAVLQAYINACRAGSVIPLSLTGTGLQELVGDIMRELKVRETPNGRMRAVQLIEYFSRMVYTEMRKSRSNGKTTSLSTDLLAYISSNRLSARMPCLP